MQDNVWFITGCSTGLGYILAKSLLLKGYKVCVTARNTAKLIGDFSPFPSSQCLVMPLDVTNSKQINTAVENCIRVFGKIDVLVNNAGYGLFGALEEATDAQFRAVMETNVFGVFSVTRAVLPFMRARKSGHIFNMSSIAGVAASAGGGLYNTSKFALEGMSEALHLELKPLGIKVTIIEPGAFRTDFAGRSVDIAANTFYDYAESAHKSRDYIVNINGKQPGDPQKLAEAIIMLSHHHNPPMRLLLGKDALIRAETKLKKWTEMIEEWRTLTTAMDFDS